MAADTLAQYRLLILPDLPVLSEAQAELLRAWVRAGGALLAAGAVGTHDERGAPRPDWVLGDVLGARHLGLAREYAANRVGSYFVAEPHPITAALPPTELALPGPHRRVAATTAQVLGWHVLPVTAETRERWVNWHSAPPARRGDDPALLLNRFGAGTVVYCAPPLFPNLRGDVLGQTYPDAVRSYHGGIILRWPRALLAGAIAHLLPAPRVRLDASPRVEATFFTREGGRQLVVHLLNRAVRGLGGAVRLDERVRLRVHRGLGSPRRLAQVWPREDEGWPSEFRPEGEELVAEGQAPALHTILVADL